MRAEELGDCVGEGGRDEADFEDHEADDACGFTESRVGAQDGVDDGRAEVHDACLGGADGGYGGGLASELGEVGVVFVENTVGEGEAWSCRLGSVGIGGVWLEGKEGIISENGLYVPHTSASRMKHAKRTSQASLPPSAEGREKCGPSVGVCWPDANGFWSSISSSWSWYECVLTTAGETGATFAWPAILRAVTGRTVMARLTVEERRRESQTYLERRRW